MDPTPTSPLLRRTAAAAGDDAGNVRPRTGGPLSRPPTLQTANSSSASSRASKASKASKASMASTSFYGSQIGGQTVINYSYTDLPWKLVAYDIYYFFRLAWALPYIVWPVAPAESGPMSELALTLANLWCIAVHAGLAVLQLVFLLGLLPAAALLPVWMAAGLVGVSLGLNHVLCTLLNGVRGTIEYHSNPNCAPARPEHAHEQWVFLNGVAVGSHWMQSNLDRLALTFKRPILGIHNKTSGIVFDVIECLIQRNYTYATRDVRVCYGIIKETLYRPEISKVVFILHSQGGIEGGLVLDWLLQELPQDLLAKLEVYTFGNAANHFNNPHRTVNALRREAEAFGSAYADPYASTAAINGGIGTNGAQGAPLLVAESAARQPASVSGQAIGHIEHYAHTSDFVALWGVLHFVTTVSQTNSMPRFMGRVFARTSARGGHQFCQHYLDGMFPLARHPTKPGEFVGCAETGNAFMESDVQVGRDGDESAVVHGAFERSWLAALEGQADQNGQHAVTASPVNVEIHASSPVLARQASRPRPVKVKDVSRLWQYRNGRSPDEDVAKGLSRLATI